MSETTSFITTRDGSKIAYKLHGNPSAQQRVVLVHSLAMDHHYWTSVAKLLISGAAVLTYDCRGHGQSDKPKGPYTIDLFADDLADLMAHIGWSKAVIGGSSMGGSVTLAFAIRYPQLIAGLALIDTTSYYGDDAPTAWAGRAAAALEKGLGSLIEFQLTRWFSEKFKKTNAKIVQACVDTFLKNDVHAYAETCKMLGNFDVRSGLSTIKVPTRIIVGEEDYATPPAMAEVLHKNIARSKYDILPKARHLTPLECPERIAQEIRALL
jgi:3-oxoadipate enol-lactonase